MKTKKRFPSRVAETLLARAHIPLDAMPRYVEQRVKAAVRRAYNLGRKHGAEDAQ